MKYINRTIEEQINIASKYFAGIVIYGPRQVGKSTTIEHLFKDKIKKISLDILENRIKANDNPRLFLESIGYPVIIDEIQKAPPLLDEIKVIIDNKKSEWLENDKSSELLFILTGSNRFELQKHVSESLAGRVAVLEMNSLTNVEKNRGVGSRFYPDIEELINKQNKSTLKYKTREEIFDDIFIGGMPEYIVKDIPREVFFRSYIQTYISQDVRNEISVEMEVPFRNFLNIIALRTGNQVNYTDISNKVGMDVRTIKKWISILEASGLIYLLYPYMPNMSDRIVKSPKLYFMDTGLCAYLCGWADARMLENGVMSGAFFETYVVSDIIKNLQAYSIDPNQYLYYYRDSNQKEVDLLYVDTRGITPIEIKKSISPSKPTKNFDVLKKYKLPILKGLVIDNVNMILPINEKAYSYPVYLLGN